MGEYARVSESDPVRGVSAWTACLVRAKAPEQARAVFVAALAKPQSVSSEIGLRLSFAEFLEGHGTKEAALEEFRKAADLATAHHESWIVAVYANALRGMGRLDEAIAAYERAVALNPGDGPSHAGLGMALGERQRFAASLEHLETAHRLGVADPAVLLALMERLAELGRGQEIPPLLEECQRRGIEVPVELRDRIERGRTLPHGAAS